ncbi:hypothetical protein KUH32_03030 [Thalassococcus sp. CAU 1522]|uniref:Uncharacterized protein n=1 Tax=Thalassococcus arenae TaxID=2851652 RepID=A0ABS6N547_9RHOB|nr:hypothetical protein [Thalassococcus arenae]MBV2358734.1 hypothetical protein [Thalassococcus arenae]
MDPLALVFYAVICGALSLAGPRLGPPWRRFAVGAAVGVVAVIVLPLVRGVFF